MAHRSLPREVAFGSFLESEGMGAAEKHRVTRRGRSATPGLASHWEENRGLYMDNLRLWDCLTLIRSDPTMTCQNAIKLVFSLDDDEYFRMFPDTRQLMLLMFPGGVVYHSSNEEAKIEKARLKDENARLHAAVWVLRDNPSFQADSTVAAIFRLDEAQFQSKFNSVNVATLEPPLASTPNKVSYQNNNKEKKKTNRTSMGPGHEPSMAIQLTNCPVKGGSFAGDRLSSKGSRQPRSQSMMQSSRHSQHINGCFNDHQDFTSNWKPTTPLEQQPSGGKIRTSKRSHLKSDWAILCWRQNCYLRPVDLHALDEAKSTVCVRHVKSAHNPSRKQNSSKCGRHRQLRRSNTVAREDDVVAERISKGPSQDAPVKCVSFAEPLPSYQTGSSIATKLICLKDKVSMILDTSSGIAYPAVTQEDLSEQRPETTDDAGTCDPKKNADAGVAKNANTNKRGRKSYKRSKVYTLAAAREPSKRCQRDTATSPVLDTRTCVLILAKSRRSKMANSRAMPLSSSSDDCILNKSNNNDTITCVEPSRWSESNGGLKSSKRLYARPLSPKFRDLRQARLKNLISCKKFNGGYQIRQKHNIKVTCSTNNALSQEKHKSTLCIIPESDAIVVYSSQQREQGETNGKANYKLSGEKDYLCNDKLQSTHSSHTSSVSESAPQIQFSKKPGTLRGTKHRPYPHASYTTVKQFLDRHHNLLHDLPINSPPATEETTTEEMPSTSKLSSDKLSPLNQEYIVESGVDTERLASSSSRKVESAINSESQHQHSSQKHKDRWNKSETLLLVAPSLKTSNVKCSASPAGKLKLCADNTDKQRERLNRLRQLGNCKYSKPLATMLKRNGGFQWQLPVETPQRYQNWVFNDRHSSSDWAKLDHMYFGPFITFIPLK